jgi:hypothetical protein
VWSIVGGGSRYGAPPKRPSLDVSSLDLGRGQPWLFFIRPARCTMMLAQDCDGREVKIDQ